MRADFTAATQSLLPIALNSCLGKRGQYVNLTQLSKQSLNRLLYESAHILGSSLSPS